MKPAQIPANETDRLAALRRYDVLDTPAESEFDDFTRLASQICGTPIALISLVDAGRQWFKSKLGLEAPQTPRDISFCGHAIHERELFEVPNALADARFRDNPLVSGAPDIRFYAGMPLVTPDGYGIGTLCVIDRVPHQLTPAQRDGLAALGRQVVHLLELRLVARRVSALNQGLAQQADFQRTLLDSAALAVVATSVEGVITRFNRAAEELLGYTAGELVGKLALGLFHDRAEVAARAQALSREQDRTIEPGFEVFVANVGEGKPETREWTYLRKDGSHVPVQLSVSAVRDEQGRLTGFLGLAQDISARKQAERDLVTAKERLGLALAVSNMATWDVNIGTGEAFLDERWAAMMGDEPAREATSIGDLVRLAPAGDRDRLLEAAADAISGRAGEYRVEHQVYTKAGERRWIQSRGKVVVRDPSGRALRMIGVNSDITEHKQAEQRLRDAAARIEAIFATVADGIITIDERGSVENLNPAAERIFGYAAAEVIGQNIKMLISEPYHGQHDGYLEHYRATGEAQVIGIGREVVGRRRDGSTFPLELAVSKMQLGDERRFTGIVRDITERKRAEQALIAARDAAQHANRAKDSFLATMSHEIRTPLGGLMGMLELLSLSRLDAEQAETLATARDSGRSLLRILNDILDWSKIEEGKLELALQATSITALVADVANTYSHVASANSVTLTPRVDARLSPAHLIDPLRLSQVLNNFVSNAIKFGHGGRVELQVDLLGRVEGVEEVRFSVKDTGVGIAPEVQRRLFQSYGQASADTARIYGGTGLGLAICRRLADLMDARIDLESQLGRGSTFSITLMLPVEETVAESRQAPAGVDIDTAAFAPPLVAGIAAADAPRVLVVDDHPTNRKLLTRQLGLLGLHAETAENGAAALALWRADRYPLVITDCHMPVMDGYALARALRDIEAAEARPRTPIFAWTANALPDEIENCKAAGMDELLVKPTDLVQLKQVLAKWLPIATSLPIPHLTSPLKGEESDKSPSATVAVPPGPTLAALDVSVLAALVGDDPAVIRDFLLHFRASAQAISAELGIACAAGNATQAGALAHKLKSSARSVGAFELGRLCDEMEQAGKAGDKKALAALWPGFEQELDMVEQCLDSLLQAGTSD